VKLSLDSKSILTAVKTSLNPNFAELIRREAIILKKVKHPLIVELLEYVSDTPDHNSVIVTEFAVNGSLTSHLSQSRCRLNGANRITRVIVGIALAMRYFHSQGGIHRDLKPDNILLDWDWNVRIADFGHSISREKSDIHSVLQPGLYGSWPSVDCHYLAPECYNNLYFPESDVFSFAMILYEILVGQPAFPKELNVHQMAYKLVITDERPVIPKSVPPSTQKLITDCWANEPGDRPSFAEIVERLEELKFKVMPNVNSQKLRAFVKKVEEFEERSNTDSQ
jgi:serine/threonine protein kinase